MNIKRLITLFILGFLFFYITAQDKTPFVSDPLTIKADFSGLMTEGIDSFLTKETERIKQVRKDLWRYDFSSLHAFNASISDQRDFLANRVGIVDNLVKSKLEVLSNDNLEQIRVETDLCVIRAVRWAVLEGMPAEGILLQPKGKVLARVIIVPDADILPEVIAGFYEESTYGYSLGRKLAEKGIEVLIPVLVSRENTFSGNELVGRYTNQTHREWIYRQAYEVGRHIIGYELQKIFAAIDWMKVRDKLEGTNIPIGIAGYGEGGLLGLYAAALDQRISSTLISGYFNSREQLWREPMYRNVFGLLKYFSDAELAVLVWPRKLVIEHSLAPEIDGPPVVVQGRSGGAAPGSLSTPSFSSVQTEFNRLKEIIPDDKIHVNFYYGNQGSAIKPFSQAALNSFIQGLKIKFSVKFEEPVAPLNVTEWIDPGQRQERTVRSMEGHVQKILSLCERTRNDNFWQTLEGNASEQQATKDLHRQRFWEVIGRLPAPSLPPNTKSRLLNKTDKWTSYEITLDVWPGVFAWGILLIPNDLIPGEKRPVIVCQHGLEGLPADVVTTDPLEENFYEIDGKIRKYIPYNSYKGFAARLAERGYITFAPHNPYRGGDKFRVLQRKANPLGLSLFSIITGQHQRIVEWLGSLSFVDPSRIGFYGLSYGGKTAMRVPALIKEYALSICSGDFYEWVRYNAGTDNPTYMFTGEYEIFEWDLGHTFNYAEMAGLIAPRPFMVERGNYDNPWTDQWLAYEFAKVRRHYDFLELQKNCRIEYFNAGHTINGVGTFEFIDRHFLNDTDK